MSKDQLLHIFDESACLTRRQMKDYVNGSMTNEESHAVEVHLNACPFCNDAIEALFESREGDTADMVMNLNNDFLQDHLGMHNPRVHLNSVAAAHTGHLHGHTSRHKRKSNVTAFWRNTSIAAILLLAIGLLWFLKFGNTSNPNRQVAQQTATPPEQVPHTTTGPATSAAPTISSSAQEGTIASSSTPAIKATAPIGITATQPEETDKTGKGGKAETGTLQVQEKPTADKTADVAFSQPVAAPAGKNEAPPKKVAVVEKMPARKTSDIASTAPAVYSGNSKAGISGARDEAVSYTIEGVDTRPAKAVARENLDKAAVLLGKGQYQSALRVCEREMDNEDRGFRQEAMVTAAQCYIKLGDTSKAKQILSSVAEEGGPQRRAARKLLKELNKEK